MLCRLAVIVSALAFVGSVLACQPQIGKSCTLSTDCSQLGDRLCDSSQPGGYCTIFNCSPNICPNSVCVAFGLTVDPACGPSLFLPLSAQNYCLAPCGSDSDCRTPEYECVDLSDPVEQQLRSAEVVDTDPLDGGFGYQVCMVAGNPDAGVVSYAPNNVPAICRASNTDGGIPASWVTYTNGAGGGGAGGAPPADAGPSDQSGVQLDASPSDGSAGG
jgi:hypothetical protein